VPKDFDDCVKDSGKVITKRLKHGRYMHICFDKKGKAYPGEIKKKKKSKSNKKIIKNARATKDDLMKLQKVLHEKFHN
jgi:hypothetical protein